MITAVIKTMEDILFKGTLNFEFYREIQHNSYAQSMAWCFLFRF